MADLRIVDAPVLLQESITDDVKMPTGGLGNYAISLGDIVWYVVQKEQLASKNYVDTSSKGVQYKLDTHIADKTNPHQVTKVQVGLGNVDNTADVDKPVSNAVESAIITATTDMATKAYVNSKDGDLTTLTTTDKTSLVKAINEVVSVKADKATTLVGYGISDAYTKSEIDTNYSGVKTLYDKNAAVAGAGANGWTDQLIALENGRTQREKNLEIICVKDYGGKGDGTSDNIIAFKNAVAYAKSIGGGVVYAPAGNYKLSESLTLPVNVSLRGDGIMSTKLSFNNTDGLVLSNDPWKSNQSVKSLRISGNGITTDTAGLRMMTTNVATIENVHIDGFKHGMFMNLAVLNTFYDLYITGCDIAIYAENGSWHNRVFGGVATANRVGISGSAGIFQLIGFDIEASQDYAIGDIHNIHAVACHFEGFPGQSTGIQVGANTSYTFRDCMVSGFRTAFRQKGNETNGVLKVIDTQIGDVTTDFDMPTFSWYHIENCTYIEAGGNSRNVIANLSPLLGLHIENKYMPDGSRRYVVNGREVKTIKAKGLTSALAFGTIPAHSGTALTFNTGRSDLDVWGDKVVIRPTGGTPTLNANINFRASITDYSDSSITIIVQNISTAPVDVGSLTFAYEIS